MKENFKQWILENSDTRLYEMSVADLWTLKQGRGRVKSDKGVTSPWTKIPSTTKFEITLNEMNTVLEQIGISRRLTNAIDFGEKPHGNKPLNNYMSWQVSRLYEELEKGNSEAFFARCTELMRSSVAFRTSALNKCFPRWYKEMPFAFMININNKVNKILDSETTDLQFKRVYIPKTPADEEIWKRTGNHKDFIAQGGRWRPLGVPQHAWRVVLHMWTNFLVMFLESYIGERQHGFIPGRGTLSAWKRLVTNLHKYDYIMEIDLANCFGEIQSSAVTRILRDLGMPRKYAEYVERVNLSTPTWAKEDFLDESEMRRKQETNEFWANPETYEEEGAEEPGSVYCYMDEALSADWRERFWQAGDDQEAEKLSLDLLWDFIGAISNKEGEPIAEGDEGYSELVESLSILVPTEEEPEKGPFVWVAESLNLPWAVPNDSWKSVSQESHKGLPQGANWSPILTAAVLKEFTNQCEDAVFYADDGLFFSNKPIELKEDPDKGIYINYKKRSGYVKEKGKFTKDFVFLGLEYKHETDMIAGHTHKGSRLEFNSKEQDLFAMLELLRPPVHYNRQRWELLFHSSIGGTIMSNLYNASWEQLEYLIHWNPEGVKHSWVSLKGQMDNYKTTSSDACFALSRVISEGAQKIYANKAESMRIRVERVQGASDADDARNLAITMGLGPDEEIRDDGKLKVIVGAGKWIGDHKKTYRAMYVKGRWIRKKVVETLNLEVFDQFLKVWQTVTDALAYGTTLKGMFNGILLETSVDLKRQSRNQQILERMYKAAREDFIDEDA